MTAATTEHETLTDTISHLYPCDKAKAWLSSYRPGEEERAWTECRDGSWMLWLIGKQTRSAPWGDDRKQLLGCALDCSETVKHLWPESQREKIQAAISVLRAWIDGTVSVEEAQRARDELRQVYRGSGAYAAYAAYAAEGATYAAEAATYAAEAATYAAEAAARAGGVYDAYAARAEINAKTADIVRKHFPLPPVICRPSEG